MLINKEEALTFSFGHFKQALALYNKDFLIHGHLDDPLVNNI